MKNGYVNYTIPEEIAQVPFPEEPLNIPGSFAKILKLFSLGKPILVSWPGVYGSIIAPAYGTLVAVSSGNDGPTEISLSGSFPGKSVTFHSNDTVSIS